MTADRPNPALAPLDPLVGEWNIRIPQFPGPGGRVAVEWVEGGAFVRLRFGTPDPAPDSTWVVGRDDSSQEYTVLYHDARGVSRVYRMSLTDREWRLWREAPGFWQRFSGTLSDDGASIRGAWEKSPDGERWEHDFDLLYTRST